MGIYKEVARYSKTIEIELIVNNCRVVSLKLSGDFFVYPEDAIEKVEESARGCTSAECLIKALDVLRDVTILGFDLKDVKEKIINAFNNLCRESGSS